jgi:AcrR family transcriptional regulator
MNSSRQVKPRRGGRPPGRVAGRAGSAREPLTRERIADAALRLIDGDGLDALSMRKLGTELGVEAMALYHHFPSKGDLLDAVMDRLLLDMDLPARDAMEPLARLRQALRSYRHLAIAHPHAFPLLVGRRFNTDAAFALYERLLDAFADAGLPPEQAARWFRTTGYFTSGAGMADIASRELEPSATPLKLERDPGDPRYPHVAAVAQFLKVKELDAVFEFGLDVLFEALSREAHSRR